MVQIKKLKDKLAYTYIILEYIDFFHLIIIYIILYNILCINSVLQLYFLTKSYVLHFHSLPYRPLQSCEISAHPTLC